MKLEKIDSKIPQSEQAIQANLKNCTKANRIETFKKEDAKTFLAKARYHIQAAESFKVDSYLDWAIIAYYAAMYMASKAFTAHYVQKAAKDHGCTIALMLDILHGKKFARQLSAVREKFEEEVELLAKVRQYRNSVLYSITEVNETALKEISKIADDFVEEINKLIEGD